MIRYIFSTITFLVVCVFCSDALAVELKLPTYKSHYTFKLGTQLIHLSGNPKVAEFEDTRDALVLSSDIEMYPLPHRFHFYGTFISDNDYYLDTGYAYRDILLTRLISLGFVHHTDNYDFPLLDASANERYSKLDRGQLYKQDIKKTLFTLRLKKPNYPFHIFTNYFNYHQKGAMQQRFLIGYFGDMTKISESRSIKKDTTEILIGTNGHFGPIEIEYSHIEKRFNPGGTEVLYDAYPAIGSRPADTYPHNILPELKGSANFLKVHTSYTGQIVASATIGRETRKNEYSGVRRRIFLTSGIFRYLPMHELTFLLKFYYQKTKETDANTTVLYGLSNSLSYDVRDSLDIEKKILTLMARIRPLKHLTLIPAYKIEKIDRTDTDEWLIANGDTTRHTYSLKVLSKPFRHVSIRAKFSHLNTQNPVYNSEPDRKDTLNIHLTYSPIPRLSLTTSYTISYDKHERTIYHDALTDSYYDARDKTGRFEHLIAMLNSMIGQKTTLSTGIAYYHVKEKSALVFKRFQGGYIPAAPYIEDHVPYKDRSTTYIVDITHRLNNRVTLGLQYDITYSKGSFSTLSDTTAGIEEFSKIDIRDQRFSVNGEYEINQSTKLKLDLLYESYKDRTDSDLNGRFYKGVLTLSKTL